MVEVLGKTWSLCPVCLKKIPAARVVEEGDVYLAKECDEHGSFKALVWRGTEDYKRLYRFDSKL